MDRKRLAALVTTLVAVTLFVKAPALALAEDASETEASGVTASAPQTAEETVVSDEAPGDENGAADVDGFVPANETVVSDGETSDGNEAVASDEETGAGNEISPSQDALSDGAETPSREEDAPSAEAEVSAQEPSDMVDSQTVETAETTDDQPADGNAPDDPVIEDETASYSSEASEAASDTTTKDPQGAKDDFVAQASITPVTPKTESQSASEKAQAELDKLAKEHAGSLPAGRYAIYSKARPATKGDTATYALDVRGGSKASGAAIILYKAKASTNQRWDIAYLSSGYATIKSAMSGLYLTLKGGKNAFANGTAQVVQQKYQKNAPWQQWIIVKQSDGSFKLISALLKNGTSQRTVDVKGGKAKNSAQTILYAPKSSTDDNQRFTIRVTADILDAEAKQHKGDIKNGTYLFGSSLEDSYRLNMRRASMSNRGEAVIYAGDDIAVNEGWDIVHTTKNYVYIINSKSGKALDVRGGSAKNGASIIQWSKKTNARNQLWICVRESNGSYKFVSALAGNVRYVLSVKGGKASGGATIDIERDKGSSSKAQHWSATAAPAQYAYAHAIADGTYYIQTPLEKTKVLGVGSFSTKEQAQVKLWGNAQTDNLLWKLTHDDQGFVLLKNKYTGKYLAFSKAKVDGATVTAQSATAGKWIVKPASGSAFTLVDGASGKNVDLSRNSTADGAKVISYKASGGKNQNWVITKQAAKITIPNALKSAFSGVDLTKVKALGIDVSVWDENIDWQAVKKAGIQFAILRVGHGTTITDAKLARNVRGCRSAGIKFGVYYYSTARSVAQAKKEANHALSVMKSVGITSKTLDYPVFYDLEEPSLAKTSNRKLFANMASTFLSSVKKSGYQVGVYANLNWWNNYLTDPSFNNYQRWVAQWRVSRCGYKGTYKFWQTRDSGRVPGISGPVDMDVMYY